MRRARYVLPVPGGAGEHHVFHPLEHLCLLFDIIVHKVLFVVFVPQIFKQLPRVSHYVHWVGGLQCIAKQARDVVAVGKPVALPVLGQPVADVAAQQHVQLLELMLGHDRAQEPWLQAGHKAVGGRPQVLRCMRAHHFLQLPVCLPLRLVLVFGYSLEQRRHLVPCAFEPCPVVAGEVFLGDAGHTLALGALKILVEHALVPIFPPLAGLCLGNKPRHEAHVRVVPLAVYLNTAAQLPQRFLLHTPHSMIIQKAAPSALSEPPATASGAVRIGRAGRCKATGKRRCRPQYAFLSDATVCLGHILPSCLPPTSGLQAPAGRDLSRWHRLPLKMEMHFKRVQCELAH